MAKKGFSVGKEALFKKIMPTNQEEEEAGQENIEITSETASVVEAEEQQPVEQIEAEPIEAAEADLAEIVQEKQEVVSAEPKVEEKIVEPVTKPVIKIEPEQPVANDEQLIPEPLKEVAKTETADEMQQKDIVRPMIYGLPEDKQPAIQQVQQNQAPVQQPQQMMQPPQMMPGQEIPMYPAPGYMQSPYPMPTPEQAAQMAAQGVAYQQQYMPNGYPPQYYPMAPNPYYHPNAAFATMYYATGQDGQPQQVVLPQMVVDGAKLSLYDMLEDVPPVITEQEEKKEPTPTEVKNEPQEEVILKEEPTFRWHLVNVVEQLLKDKVSEFMKRDKDMCQCDKCKLDVMALALNRVHPHYITAEEFSRALMELYYQEHKVDIMVAIFEAIDIVKATPRHDEK